MGVRISIFAFDAGPLRAFLEKPVSEVLQFFARHGTDLRSSVIVYDRIQDGIIHATVERGVFLNKDGLSPISKAELFSNPELQRSAIEVFNADSDIGLKMLLRSLSSCPTLDFIKQITDGYRTWWVNSFLEGIKGQSGAAQSDHEVVSNMLVRLVSLYGRPTAGFASQEVLRAEGFPIIPDDAGDHAITLWQHSEIEVLLKVIRPLLASGGVRFGRPPGQIGIGPDSDEEWNDWVYNMLRQLAGLEDVPFRPLRTINFMG